MTIQRHLTDPTERRYYTDDGVLHSVAYWSQWNRQWFLTLMGTNGKPIVVPVACPIDEIESIFQDLTHESAVPKWRVW